MKYTENSSEQTIECNNLDISYSPAISYWSDLGYTYSKGVVKVVKDSGNRNVDYLSLTNSTAGYFVNGDTLTVIDFTATNGSNFKSGSGTATLTMKIEKDTVKSKDSVTSVKINSGNVLSGVTKINVLKATVSIK